MIRLVARRELARARALRCDRIASHPVVSKGKAMRVSCYCVLVLALGTVGAVSAAAQEKKIKRSELPPAVEKTVAAQSQGATICGFSQEGEKGQIYYEAELLVDG